MGRLPLYLLSILYFFTFPAFSANEIKLTFDFTDQDTYLASVFNNRNSDSLTSSLSTGIRVLPTGSDLIRVSITGLVDPYTLELVLRRRDLYVVGFIADRRGREGAEGRYFYRFSDETGVNVAGFDTAHTITLNSQSTYTDLERISQRSRGDLQISHQALITDANFLIRQNGPNLTSDTARALLRFVVSVSESLRFPEISTWVADSLSFSGTASGPMGDHLVSLTNDWGQLSQYARNVTQNRALTFTGRQAWEREIDARSISTVLAVALCASASGGTRNAMVRAAVSQCDDSYNITVKNKQYDKEVLWLYVTRHDEL